MQSHYLVPMVSSENLYGRCYGFLNLPMVSGFTWKIYTFINESYYCILDLYFDIHFLNNLFMYIFLKTANFLKITKN